MILASISLTVCFLSFFPATSPCRLIQMHQWTINLDWLASQVGRRRNQMLSSQTAVRARKSATKISRSPKSSDEADESEEDDSKKKRRGSGKKKRDKKEKKERKRRVRIIHDS